MRAFERILQLGFQDDHELMLQIGRALFREGLIAPAHRFFDLAAAAHPDSPEAAACLGYAAHRLGNDAGALYWLRRALEIDAAYSEARIYLANLLYDRGETEAALHHLERTEPEDHYDELGIWRHIELKKTLYRLPDDDPELRPGSPGSARWRASRTPSTCCWPKSRRSRPTAACATRTSSSCSARC